MCHLLKESDTTTKKGKLIRKVENRRKKCELLSECKRNLGFNFARLHFAVCLSDDRTGVNPIY